MTKGKSRSHRKKITPIEHIARTTVAQIANFNMGERDLGIIKYMETGYYFHSANNSQKAAIDAFRLLSRRKQLNTNRPLEFDQQLCMRLVKAYDLSCVDCKLECEMHEWEANK